MTARKTAKKTPAKKKTGKTVKSAKAPARKKASPSKATAKPAARKTAAKPTRKATAKAAPEKPRRPATEPAAEATPAKPPTQAHAEKAAGKFAASDVNLGHVFALRPRVSTTFKQADFLTARRQLEGEGWASIQEAARAVAEKALSLTNEAKSKRGFKPGR